MPTISARVMGRLPVFRGDLEPQVDFLGREISRTGNPLEVMIDATRPTKDVSTEVVVEIRRLWDLGFKIAPNKLGDREGFATLTPEENTELWKEPGKLVDQLITATISSDAYKLLPPEHQAGMLEDDVARAQNITRQ